MHLGPGAMVGTSVRLQRRLGAGGMGAVWVADHLGLNTQVVVKFLGDHLAEVPEAIARFKREAASAAAVKSPHVVQMLDFGVTDGTPYIVMELLEGHDLRRRLEERGPLPPHEVAAIVTQVAKALQRAHEAGVIHRDIKPDNIFLTDVGAGESFVKVLDFGIAKTSLPGGMSATQTGAAIGTPYYMSPEQTLGAKSIDHRTDLWSLGVVAFEALTRTRTFDGETMGALAVAVCHGRIPMPSERNPSLGPAIDAWFARACARDPSQRFATARELAEALERAVREPRHGQVFESSDSMVGPTLPMVGGATALPATGVAWAGQAAGTLAPRTELAPGGLATTGASAASAIDHTTAPPMASRTPLLLVAAVALSVAGLTAFFVLRAPSGSSAAAASAAAPAEEPAPRAAPTKKLGKAEPQAPSPPEPAAASTAAASIAAPVAKDPCAPGKRGSDGRCDCPAGFAPAPAGSVCLKKTEAVAPKSVAPAATTAKPSVSDPNIF